MAIRVGMTGNIGCGKSTVGAMLRELGAEYLDTDRIVHELYQPGSEETGRIVARFGSTILGEDGAIDRRRLGQIVFGDPAALRDLEAILHPSVRKRIRARFASTTAPAIIVDAIKLFESGLVNEVDTVWVVTCTRDQQRQRLMETRGYTPDEAESRIIAQGPQEEKVRRAQTVIDNSGGLEQTREQVRRAWTELMQAEGSS